MRTLLMLLLAAGLVLLPSCSGEEAEDNVTDQVEEVADEVNKASEASLVLPAEESSSKEACCGGVCGSAEGSCCLDGGSKVTQP